MIRHDKADGNYVDIPAVFTSATGALAEPDTSFKLYLYPANSETATLNGVDLDEIGTSGVYSYTWDVSAVAVGNYHGSVIAVDGGVSYPMAVSVEITDTNTRLTTMDTNVDSVLEDTSTTLPALIAVAGGGSGTTAYPLRFTETDSGEGIAGLNVWLTTDSAGTNLYTARNNRTDSGGYINFYIQPNTTYYVFTEKSSAYVQTISA